MPYLNCLRHVVVILALLLTGCAKTKYVSYSEGNGDISPFARTVAFEIDRQLYVELPNCVVVMPPVAVEGLNSYPDKVESALSHHLTKKISRIISPTERDLAINQMSVDLSKEADRNQFFRGVDCDTYLAASIIGPGRNYLIVWSQVQIGVDAKLVRAHDGVVLWQARHIAKRSDGGLPLSPVGAVLDAFWSTNFSADKEVDDSVVDDAVRRLVASLPDLRTYPRQARQ